jgi:threonine aldolase
MEKAIRIRKMLGGGMRQVGVLAAAGLYALDHHRDRLHEDHQKAKAIGQVLQKASYVAKLEPIETNIVIFELASHIKAYKFIRDLQAKDILISDMGGGKLRMVTHLDYTYEMHEKLLDVLETVS